MNALSRPDLGRLDLDEGSLLGQALSLGVGWGKLPAHLPEALKAFVQASVVTYARRNRTGIAVDEAVMRRGLKKTVVSVELALRDRCGDDIESAVAQLAAGNFEALRREGWELAFGRLETMRDRSTLLLESPAMAFLQEYLKDTRVWSQLMPETWQAPDDNEREGVRELDPVSDYARWLEAEGRWAVLRLVPEKAFKRFRSAARGRGGFGEVARNLGAALALGLDRLVLIPADLDLIRDRVRDGLFPSGDLAEILEQLDAQLQLANVDPDVRRAARLAVSEELELVVDPDRVEGFFVTQR